MFQYSFTFVIFMEITWRWINLHFATNPKVNKTSTFSHNCDGFLNLRVCCKVQIYSPSCDFHEDNHLNIIKVNEYWNIKLQIQNEGWLETGPSESLYHLICNKSFSLSKLHFICGSPQLFPWHYITIRWLLDQKCHLDQWGKLNISVSLGS